MCARRGAVDLVPPSILYPSYLTGTVAMGRRCAWTLWLRMAFEAYAASVPAAKILAQPATARVAYLAALVIDGTIVLGVDRLGSGTPDLDLFD